MTVQIKSPMILAEATHTGVAQEDTWPWKASELPAVFQKAKELKIASIGGEPQFVLPDGIYDMYWIGINLKDQAGNETWEEYVIRSNDESLALLTKQIQTVDFQKLAAEEPFVRASTLDKGVDPLAYLFYEMYFNSEQEISAIKKWAKETGLDKHILDSRE